MSELPITSAFNDAYIEEMYESFARDPFSVDESWRQFFQLGRRLAVEEDHRGAAPALEHAAARSLLRLDRLPLHRGHSAPTLAAPG